MFIVYALPLNSSWSLLPWAIGSEKTYLWLCLLLMALHWFRSIKVHMNMWTFLQNRKQLLLNSTVTESHPARCIMESSQRFSVLFPDKVIKTPQFWKAFSEDLTFLTLKPKKGLEAPSTWAARTVKCSSFLISHPITLSKSSDQHQHVRGAAPIAQQHDATGRARTVWALRLLRSLACRFISYFTVPWLLYLQIEINMSTSAFCLITLVCLSGWARRARGKQVKQRRVRNLLKLSNSSEQWQDPGGLTSHMEQDCHCH